MNKDKIQTRERRIKPKIIRMTDFKCPYCKEWIGGGRTKSQLNYNMKTHFDKCSKNPKNKNHTQKRKKPSIRRNNKKAERGLKNKKK